MNCSCCSQVGPEGISYYTVQSVSNTMKPIRANHLDLLHLQWSQFPPPDPAD